MTVVNDPTDAPLAAARSLCLAVRDAVRGEVDDVEVLVSCGDRTTYVVENDAVIPALEVGAWSVAMRALRGGRLATAATTSRDPGDSVRALRLALDAAQPDPLGAFAVTAAARDVARFADPRAWALVDEPAALRALAVALRDGARSVRKDVAVDAEVAAGRSARAVATARGDAAESASTHVSAFVMLDGNEWDAWAGVARPDDAAVADMGRALLAELPAREATCEGFFGGPREVAVVLHPRLVETLLRALFLERVALDRVLAGLSHAAPGERVAHPAFSLYDDTSAPGSLRGDVTDDEGVPGARRAVVEGGALASLPNDRRSAAARGVAPTGNGFRIPILAEDRAEAPVRVGFGHLEVSAGDTPRASLVRGKSVLVTDLLGVHSANKATGAFNNPIQGGVCLEDGVPVARVKPGAWSVTGNLHAMLRDLAGVSQERLATGGALLPWLAAPARVA